MTSADVNRILFERSGEAVLVLNRRGQVVKVNREASKLLSTEVDRLTERPVLAMVVPKDRDRVKELFLRVLGGQEREWIARVRRGDGVTRVLRMRAVPVQQEGVTEAITLFARDLTESRSGRPETLQLQTLLENLPGQLVLVLDLDGRIRYSSGLSRTHFRNEADVVGQLYESLLEPGEENERLMSEMLHEVTDGRDWGGTHWHRRADGTVLPLRAYASPYLDPRNGRILGALVACHDVSVEYDWRDRARRAQRLASIGDLVGEVVAGLADAMDRIEASVSGGGPGSNGSDGASVLEEISWIRGVTTSLKDFTASTGPNPERLALPDEVRAVVDDLMPRVSELGIDVRLERPEELGTIFADRPQVRRVVRLLMENALESETDSVVVSFKATQDAACLQVADSGCGVDEDRIHRLFEPFFTTKPGHVGLGLAMARALVVGHGGDMRAQPGADGSGLTVVACFPFEAPGSTLRFRPVPLELGRTRSILVVDDDEGVRTSIRRFLEKVGFEVREAWSGRSALAQITVGHPPELVLTDLRMTDGSGDWFLDQLARDFPDLLRRTVMLTGEAGAGEMKRLVRETGCPVMTKPLEMSHLLDVLDEVAGRN